MHFSMIHRMYEFQCLNAEFDLKQFGLVGSGQGARTRFLSVRISFQSARTSFCAGMRPEKNKNSTQTKNNNNKNTEQAPHPKVAAKLFPHAYPTKP